MQILADKRIQIRVRDPNVITTLIPHATLHEGGVLTMPHTLEETKVLRNLGVPVPSPILTDYDWPSSFKCPMQHQIETAAFLTLYRKCFCLNDMGTAKTMSALWAADWLMRRGVIRRALVLSMLSCLDAVWQR